MAGKSVIHDQAICSGFTGAKINAMPHPKVSQAPTPRPLKIFSPLSNAANKKITKGIIPVTTFNTFLGLTKWVMTLITDIIKIVHRTINLPPMLAKLLAETPRGPKLAQGIKNAMHIKTAAINDGIFWAIGDELLLPADVLPRATILGP